MCPLLPLGCQLDVARLLQAQLMLSRLSQSLPLCSSSPSCSWRVDQLGVEPVPGSAYQSLAANFNPEQLPTSWRSSRHSHSHSLPFPMMGLDADGLAQPGVLQPKCCQLCQLRGQGELLSTPCGHLFCAACLLPWKAQQPSCPLRCLLPIPARELQSRRTSRASAHLQELRRQGWQQQEGWSHQHPSYLLQTHLQRQLQRCAQRGRALLGQQGALKSQVHLDRLRYQQHHSSQVGKLLTIMLHREKDTLGFNIVGGQPNQKNQLESAEGIYVSRILEKGPADKVDGMQINDKIIEGTRYELFPLVKSILANTVSVLLGMEATVLLLGNMK